MYRIFFRGNKTAKPVVWVNPEDSIVELARALSKNNVGLAVVNTKPEGASGVISERDIVRGLADFGTDVGAKTVGSLMQPYFHSCLKDDLLKFAKTTMIQEGIRHLPVMDNGQVIGVVSLRDVVDMLEH